MHKFPSSPSSQQSSISLLSSTRNSPVLTATTTSVTGWRSLVPSVRVIVKLLTLLLLIWIVALIYMVSCFLPFSSSPSSSTSNVVASRKSLSNSTNDGTDHGTVDGSENAAAATVWASFTTSTATAATTRKSSRVEPHSVSSRASTLPKRVSAPALTPLLPISVRVALESTARAKQRALSKTSELRYILHSVQNFSSVATSGGYYSSHDETKQLLDEITSALLDDFDSIQTVGTKSKRNVMLDTVAEEAKMLMQEIQQRFYNLQNPSDGECEQRKTVLCRLNKGCGFGCQLHHINYCFIMAYSLNRTLVMDDRHWRYSHRGWTAAFQPLTETCSISRNRTLMSLNFTTSNRTKQHRSGDIPVLEWRNYKSPQQLRHAQQINLPIIDALRPKPNFLPPAVPLEFAKRISKFHSQPFIWWIGQIMWYLWQLNSDLRQQVDLLVEKMDFSRKPVVGVHIRRTDKIGVEAAFHNSDEYMKAAEEYFKRFDDIARFRERERRKQLSVDQIDPSSSSIIIKSMQPRRAYIATDDPSVLRDIRTRYPNWEIFGDEQVAQSASVGNRNSDASLTGIVRDIELLSRTDYLVCTFSSQVCRTAYELMQARQTERCGSDASELVRSLDDSYYYGGQNQRNWQVIVPHAARSAQEIDLKLNDVVGVSGNHWDGLSYGINRRTNRKGLFPSFKVIEQVVAVEMPASEYL